MAYLLDFIWQSVSYLPDNPANGDFLAGLIRQMVTYLQDNQGLGKGGCSNAYKFSILNPEKRFFGPKKLPHAMFIFQFRGYKTCFLILLCKGKKHLKFDRFKEWIWQQLMSLKNIISPLDAKSPQFLIFLACLLLPLLEYQKSLRHRNRKSHYEKSEQKGSKVRVFTLH